ncbi:hypothetical protein B0H16DRAFT_1591548, partial [Mycena metata]
FQNCLSGLKALWRLCPAAVITVVFAHHCWFPSTSIRIRSISTYWTLDCKTTPSRLLKCNCSFDGLLTLVHDGRRVKDCCQSAPGKAVARVIFLCSMSSRN